MIKYTTKRIFVKDASLYYEVSKGDPTLVLLHGFTLNHTVFNHAREYFSAKGYGTITPDMRGHGKSSALGSAEYYGLDYCTNDLESIIEKENVKNPILIGYSAGAIVAENYAYAHQKNTQGLVLIAGSYNFLHLRDPLRKTIFGLLPKVGRIVCQAKEYFDNGHNYYPNYGSKRFQNITPADFVYDGVTNFSKEQIYEYCMFGKSLFEWDTTSILPHIKVPSLVINGENDMVVPHETAYQLADMLPYCEEPVIIDGANHGLVFTHSWQTNMEINKFLDGLPIKKKKTRIQKRE